MQKKQLIGAPDIIHALRPIYPDDERFRTAFVEKQIRTTSARNCRVLRYILFEIERHLLNNAFDYNNDKYPIEHILPEHPNEYWTSFSDEQIDRYVYRIGNLTLLEMAVNRDIGNKSFSEKRTVFDKCGFEITKRIAAEHAEWNADQIATRQPWLARQAMVIWCLSELS